MPDVGVISMTPIGVLHTPFTDPDNTPIQPSRSNAAGQAEVFPAYAKGLEGVEGFSHIYLIYAFFEAGDENTLLVKPFLDDRERGVFSTRFPLRPNPIGISIIRLVNRAEYILHFEGADMLDGSLLLDIKPYLPDFDVFQATRTGWYQHRSKD